MRLARVYDKVQQRTQQHLRRFGLTPSQFDVLAHVGAAEGLSQQQLAERLLVTKGNVCGLINRMEQAGLLVRRADPEDRRVHRLALTPKGRRLYAEAVPSQERLVATLFGGIEPQEQRVLQDVLRRLDRAMAD
jgi:DNA-binding MarR family transcriptional regulator